VRVIQAAADLFSDRANCLESRKSNTYECARVQKWRASTILAQQRINMLYFILSTTYNVSVQIL
jgi:hypothetical protein